MPDAATIAFIRTGRQTIDGWFDEVDAWLFAVLHDLQAEAGVHGDLLEVGAYLGKSAAELGFLRRGDERVVVCDVFEDSPPAEETRREAHRWYGGLTRQRFEANYRRFHAEPPVVLAGDSRSVLPSLKEGSCRFIHVDGSHAYDVVLEDLRNAQRLLHPRGLIAIDDLTSRHTPGVSAAVWESVAYAGLVPLVTTTKFYGTWGDAVPLGDLDRRIHPFGLHVVDRHQVRGHDILEVRKVPEAVHGWKKALHEVTPPGIARFVRGAIGRTRRRAASPGT